MDGLPVGNPDIAFGFYGTGNLNQSIFTVMSYNGGWATGPQGLTPSANYGSAGTLMALDIASLQQDYGVNTTYHTGNDTYALPVTNAAGTYYSCIWDAGGADTIRNTSALDSVIDLRAATLLQAEGGGGYVSSVAGVNGGFTIARNAVIENAQGGSGKDMITGNFTANTLNGGGGNDRMSGVKGTDTINGGDGKDTIIGGEGADSLSGGTQHDVFVFYSVIESAAAAFDTVSDFQDGIDDIYLAKIDAQLGAGTANDAFTFISDAAFNGVKGELRFEQNTSSGFTLVMGDVNGDSAADFQLRLTGLHTLTASDFVL